MLFPSLLLFLAFTGAIADIENDFKACLETVNLQDLEDMMNMKSSEELGVVCPMILNLFNCIEDVLKTHTGLSFEAFARLTAGTDVGKGAEVIVNTRNVFEEVCTEGSPLNNDYMADIDCFDRIQDPTALCERKANAAYEAFEGFVDNADEEDGDDDSITDKDCMKTAYQSACMATIIHDTCGRRAFDTYNTIVKRTTIFKNAICSEDGLHTLKNSFLDSLEMEEDQRELFRLAFDLRKRRK